MPKGNVKGPDSRENIVYRFFKLIEDKDVDGLLDLFDYDATVYEPFSKAQGLHGRSLIEPFLKVAMMANRNMHRKIKILKAKHGQEEGQLTALVTFERGDRVKGRFTFDLKPDEKKGWKIKTLDIKFMT
ncbi:hypothetical protein NVIE_003970 [Nitrososphaera viennensis EN76]|uniref:SnoaL-like domain-containing protein n=2 Tax=Nitrososphaera viennensis TaxID=1034015 RepID=A0A060HGW6_9ARCH|nr:hypothetical protein NVIE_003970 [Nitrososphaera viennensis EN76]